MPNENSSQMISVALKMDTCVHPKNFFKKMITEIEYLRAKNSSTRAPRAISFFSEIDSDTG